MSADLNRIADGIRDALATIDGMRAYSYQPEQKNPPFAYPELVQVVYHRSMGLGVVQTEWLVHVAVGRYTDRTAHQALNDFLSSSGATSVRQVLETDLTLGGATQTLVLSNSADVTSLSVADEEFLQIQFSLTCHS